MQQSHPLHDHQLLGTLMDGLLADTVHFGLPPSTDAERYVEKVAVTGTEAATVVDQMAFVTKSLSTVRLPKRVTRYAFNATDKVGFHLENHLIRAVMLWDRALQFVNAVFRLGIPPRACRAENVAQNDHVAQTSVADVLKALDTLIKPKRSERNVVVHRSGYREAALAAIENAYVLTYDEYDRQHDAAAYEQYRVLTAGMLKTKQLEMGEFDLAATALMVNLFDAVDPVVRAQLDLLNSAA